MVFFANVTPPFTKKLILVAQEDMTPIAITRRTGIFCVYQERPKYFRQDKVDGEKREMHVDPLLVHILYNRYAKLGSQRACRITTQLDNYVN